jgi:hypothetical protein
MDFLAMRFTFLGFDLQVWMPVVIGACAIYVVWLWKTRGLAVQGERPGTQLGGHCGDRGITVGPIMAAAGEQPHGLAVPAHDQPVAGAKGFARHRARNIRKD